MKVTVTARHTRFGSSMKEYARSKAQHLEHYFDHLRKLEVILDGGGSRRFTAEMIASAVRGQVLVCQAAGLTVMAAVDLVVGKMERQLVKFKEKLHFKQTPHAGSRPGKFTGGSAPSGAPAASGEPWW
jgi:putative sigma-54 modulation protein